MIRHSGLFVLALAALAIAGWTYSVNYDTRAALDRISDLRIKIADQREALRVLRVEWAWLNRPDRLARLVERYEEKLALVPLTPDAFGYVAAVPYPPGGVDEAPAETPPAALIARGPQAGDKADAPAMELALAGQGGDQVGGQGGLAKIAEIRQEATATLPPPSEAGLSEAGLSDTAAAAALGVSLASAGEESAPTSMNEAVTLALIEAGVLQAAEPVASTATATAPAGGIPVPPARPALQAPR